jgi:hypothetical protein
MSPDCIGYSWWWDGYLTAFISAGVSSCDAYRLTCPARRLCVGQEFMMHIFWDVVQYQWVE